MWTWQIFKTIIDYIELYRIPKLAIANKSKSLVKYKKQRASSGLGDVQRGYNGHGKNTERQEHIWVKPRNNKHELEGLVCQVNI